MFRRISPRWVAEVLGGSALCVGSFLISPILGCFVVGAFFVLEGNFGTPFGPKV